MDDEQIARAFVQQMRHSCYFGTAVLVLTAIIGEARATEREACALVAEAWADHYPFSVWPEDGESLDCASARMVRNTSQAIAKDIRVRDDKEEG